MLTPENEALWYEYVYERRHLVLVKGRINDEYVVWQKLCSHHGCDRNRK